MTSVAVVLALCRLGQAAAALSLWGAWAFLAWLVPVPLAAAVAHRLRRWDIAAVVIAVAATALKLPAEVASIGDGWPDAVDPAIIGSVLGETGDGQAWTAQCVAALLLLLARQAPPRSRPTATAIVSALLLATLTLAGHAAMDEGWRGALHRANDAVHLLSGGAWLGALPPVLAILGLMGQEDRRPAAALALRRFSRAGHGAVALVLLSGAANTALVLGRWPSDLSSLYEALLDAKIVAVALMIGLALVNRYVLVPRLGREPEPAVAALRRATLAEVLLGLGAVALVATFGLADPR